MNSKTSIGEVDLCAVCAEAEAEAEAYLPQHRPSTGFDMSTDHPSGPGLVESQIGAVGGRRSAAVVCLLLE